VAGHEYARPNTGASITPGSSGNGALPTHESDNGENRNAEPNNRVRTLHTGFSAVHMSWDSAFDQAGNVIEAHGQPHEFKALEIENCNVDKAVAILCLKQNLYRKQFIR
jgi:hypothetical protein